MKPRQSLWISLLLVSCLVLTLQTLFGSPQETPPVSLGRVAVIPFVNDSTFKEASDVSYEIVQEIFSRHGFESIAKDVIVLKLQELNIDTSVDDPDEDQLKQLAESLAASNQKADYIVYGRVLSIEKWKKKSFFETGKGSAATIVSRIYDVTKGRKVYAKKETRKAGKSNLFTGDLLSADKIRARAIHDCLKAIYEGFFKELVP